MNTYTITITATSISVSGITSPAQLVFDPQMVTSLYGYSIAKLVYDFGDETDLQTVYTSNSGSALDVTVSHNFFRPTSADTSTFTTTISAYEFTTFACKTYSVAINLVLPDMSPLREYYPLEIRAFQDKIFTIGQLTDADSTVGPNYVVASIIVPASSTGYESTSSPATCVDPTPTSNFSVTVTASSTPVYGTAIASSAVSGTLVFVSDQGNYSSANYTSIAAAVNSITADGYLFGGNNNYPYGSNGSIASNWSGYSSLITQQKCYPALGIRDLISTGVTETVYSIVMPSEDTTWVYTVSANDSSWYTDAYVTSDWATGTTPIGFASADFLTTNVASTHPLTAWCAEVLPVTSLYARNVFTVLAGDLTNANAVRIKYRFNDAIAIYVNESLAVTNNLYTPYSSAGTVRCPQTATSIGAWTYAYIPLSSISAGSNTVAVHNLRHPDDDQSMFFDVEIATISASNNLLPSTYGAPQVQKFSYLPSNRRYYDKILPGDVHVFVLNTGVNKLQPCVMEAEPDGISLGSTQYLWFTNAILNSTSRWKVVMFHTPYFGTTQYPDYYLFPDFDWGFESLGVNLVLNGGLGLNEHSIRGKTHYVNCSCTTDRISPVDEINEYAVWTDIVENNNNKGQPAIVKINATQSDLSVHFLRASNSAIIHSFKIV